MSKNEKTIYISLMGIPDPFQYFDFRDWFRESLASYSYSQVIAKLGLKSKGHITQILQGKKNVPPHLAEKIADLFDQQGRAKQFLLALVEFTQAKSHEEKKVSLDRMTSLKAQEGKLLTPLHYDLCKQWYYPVIRELIRIIPVTDNFDELGSLVSPPVSARAAETAIRDLERMGLIVRGPKRRFIQSDAMITFGDGWKSVVVREFQYQAMELQKQSLERFPSEEREVANTTLCMSRKRANLVKRRLQEFRQEIIDLVKSDPTESEQVFQFNMGFFPLSSETRK